MRKRSLITLLSIAIVLATATIMTGCGKKGPLYLPDATQPDATQQQSDDEQSEKKSKKQKQ